MLHALYIIAFAALAVLAVGNLIRNLMMLGADARRQSGPSFTGSSQQRADNSKAHPEMLDDSGRVVDEPLLVMRSISVEDAREQLDALYKGSSNQSEGTVEED